MRGAGSTRAFWNSKAPSIKNAVESFQKAVDLNPNDVTARLYLATAWMSQYVPGADAAENVEIADKAEAQLRQALEMEPHNAVGLSSLASLMYQRAMGIADQEQKLRKLEEAASEYEKLIEADPSNKQGYYSLGVIDWVKWYAAWMRTRADLGMKPEEPGPLPDPARQDLKLQYAATIEHGISNLEKALQIDPQYSDAMAYLNLLIRERADLAGSPEQYRSEVETADHWVQKALETKKLQASANRLPGNVQAANLIRKVQPEYPRDAKKAGIQGTVRFKVVIGTDGHVGHLELVSGHPLLVDAAREAVSQWVYKPLLVDGSPRAVVTTIDVNFTLSK